MRSPRWGRRLVVAGALLFVLFAFDVTRPPPDQWSAQVLVGAIDFYRAHISPRVAASGVRCKFRPTCSAYGRAAVVHHGTLRGSLAATWRVLRCNPFQAPDTWDPLMVDGEPVPPDESAGTGS